MKKNKKLKGIKKPKFMIFTDKDGTLNLEDKQLSDYFKLITVMGGMVVPITGRTVGDIKEDFRKRHIMVPPIIVGDNGANVYSNVTNQFIIKKTLEYEKVRKIIEQFTAIGGATELIRYTDGNNIYASRNKDVQNYYQKSKTTKLYQDINKKILHSRNITKITLAGPKEQMEEITKFVETLGFWTDMDKTKFPKVEEQNYRLDIAQKNINKGEAVKRNY